MSELRVAIQNALDDLDIAVERECWEDVGVVSAYLREALSAKPSAPESIEPHDDRCSCAGGGDGTPCCDDHP